jgi:hypothetical protein
MMKHLAACIALGVLGFTASARANNWVTYEGKEGPGKGKTIVFLSGDEEYRSEEGLPMLAKLLSQRHGFTCTVLFSLGADGTIDPSNGASVEGIEALDHADLCIMLLRFRHWPDDKMKHFDDYLKSGKPIIGLRTSTHAFNNDKGSAYAKYNFGASAATGWAGGFGREVLGETWVNHWGSHKHEATKGIIAEAAKSDPLLRGVADLFVTTDVYEAHPLAGVKVLVNGQVLKGMEPTDAPADYKKKAKGATEEQGINDPMMPIAWTNDFKNEGGKTNKTLAMTMGAATDLVNEGLRRFIVNGAYAFTGLKVPEKADVTIVGEYNPTFYGFNGFKKGVKPDDLQLK